jgi:hypothetical protein
MGLPTPFFQVILIFLKENELFFFWKNINHLEKWGYQLHFPNEFPFLQRKLVFFSLRKIGIT